MNPGAQVRLDYAARLLTGSGLTGVWPRCCCWLIRLALEHAMAELWTSRCPDLVTCHAMRPKLLVLGKFVDSDTSRRVGELWNILSRAAHHHAYELAPTSAELRSWLDEATVLATRVHAAAITTPPGNSAHATIS